jgi:hypothetical protein
MTSGKKILLVSNGFYPEISPRSYRATELAKEFISQGHQVTVISKNRDYDYTDFLRTYPITLKMWKKPFLKPLPTSSGGLLGLIYRVLSRLMLMFLEYPSIDNMFKVRSMLKSEEDYDLLISFAVPYPVHWGVAMSRSVKKRIASKWIADCGDPYMGDVLDTYKKLFYFKYLEKWFCRKADFLSIPIESAIEGYYPEFHKKIKIIPQGFQFEINKVEKKEPRNTVPTFAYAGGFIKGVRDPEPLLRYLVSLNIPFKFKVFTNMPEVLNDYSDELKDKLVVSGYIPRNDLMKELVKMDFLVNFDNNTKLNSPSKLIDYAIVNRPVINITTDIDEDAVLNFLQGNYSNRMDLPNPDQYHISNVAKSFLNLSEE